MMMNCMEIGINLVRLVCGALLLSCQLSWACYLFPSDQPNPCAEKACLYGSRCVVTPDGRYATCECPVSCPSYGDSDDSVPVCGSDGRYYRNRCELDRQACRLARNLTVRHVGKCGKFFHSLSHETERN